MVDRIGTRIRERRRALGLRQSALARLAGVTASYLSRLEAGQFREPRRATLDRLATALDVRVPELLGEAPAGPVATVTGPAEKTAVFERMLRFNAQQLAALYEIGLVMEEKGVGPRGGASRTEQIAPGTQSGAAARGRTPRALRARLPRAAQCSRRSWGRTAA
jgi:transcriptional regulator with XRE-family HTH domain